MGPFQSLHIYKQWGGWIIDVVLTCSAVLATLVSCNLSLRLSCVLLKPISLLPAVDD